jgi:hypothetical protein
MATSTTQLFISHDTESDGAFANRVAEDLNGLGIDVWVAPASIRPGEQWVDAISRGLETSTHFGLVSTPNAYESPWVRKEYNAALLLESDGEIQIIPLELETTKIPLFLREFQRISFLEAYATGLQELAKLLGASQTLPLARQPFEVVPLPSRDVRPPARPIKPGVFMAYDIRDGQYVARLSEYLASHGVKLWMAPGSIDPGARWEVAITNAIVDASAIVVVMTPRSAASKWVGNEILVAEREGIPIFPILREGQPFESLSRLQFADARRNEMPPDRFIELLKRSTEK